MAVRKRRGKTGYGSVGTAWNFVYWSVARKVGGWGHGARALCGITIFGCSLFTAALIAIPADAGYEWLGPVHGEFAQPGTEGNLSGSGVAVNDATGDVYVADGDNYRVTKFDPTGGFLGAWGWDVTATGPDKAGVNRSEKIIVAATKGKFGLRYQEQAAKELEYDASAKAVEEALNKLGSIETAGKTVEKGGKVSVTGGPGDQTGSKPYVVTYEGALGDQQQTNLVPINESLTGGVPESSAKFEKITEGAPAFESCILANGDMCRRKGAKGTGQGAFSFPQSVAVDQSTGDVYVLDPGRSQGVVQVFSRDGVFISQFGELGAPGEPVEEDHPERIQRPNGIAVDSSGDVFISADPTTGKVVGEEARVMVFKPESPGDYEHYVYAGRVHDIQVGELVNGVALDSSDDVYVIANETRVFRYAPVDLAALAWSQSPDCRSKEYKGLSTLTTNPTNGTVFTYSNTASKFYRLGSATCSQNEQLGQDEEFLPAAKGNEIASIALNPTLGLSGEGGAVRPLGTLYAAGLIFGQSFVFPPAVVSETASDVGAESATIGAEIDPHGNVTHYVFQYSLDSTAECSVSHACAEVPLGGGELEASEADLAAAVTVKLLPGTTYHFRVLASSNCNPEVPSEVCESVGEDRTFTTLPMGSTGPLDGRAYELVSPPSKDGGEVLTPSPFALHCCLPGVENEHFPMQTAADGESVVYEGQPFSAGGPALDENEYLATRAAGSGWGSASPGLSPALSSRGDEQGYKAVSPDLARAIIYQIRPALAPEALENGGVPYANLYLQSTANPSALTPLLTAASVTVALHRQPGNSRDKLVLRFAGASSDFERIFFEANDALTPDAPEGNNVYEWEGGHLHLVNVLPSGTPEAGGMVGSGNELGSVDPDYSHAVSDDGTHVFWTAGNGRVYLRADGESVKIPDPGKFVTASQNGSKLLLNDGELYDLQSEELTDLTDKQGGFQGILGASEDLSKIYFVDTADLTDEEANAQKVKAGAGEYNLYLWHNGAATFIARLTIEDNATYIAGLKSGSGDWRASPADRTAQASPDGRYLAFMARDSLTGYDSNGCGSGANENCYEVFEYDASTNRLTCASCNPTGESPLGSSTLSVINPGSRLLRQPTSVSTNGRVFFNSLDTLSQQDKNGSIQDVYEYEADGVGSCVRVDGCVSLISSGEGETSAEFVDATPSGGDAFFTTRSQMVPQDPDDLIDLYDAREPHVPGERVGSVPEATGQECSSSDECRTSASSSPPSGGTPLSSTLSGVGNLVPPSVPLPSVAQSSLPTRAQLLARALKVCQKQRGKKKRATCAAKARKRYAIKANTRAAKNAGGRKSRTMTK
jgi:DNA-binding beta-propeller fold protein YncE